MEVLSAYWSWWSSNEFLVWGVGPFLSFITGFAPTALFFEWLIVQPFASKYLIDQEKSKSRTEALQETRKKIPFWDQVKSCCWTLFGPTTLFGVGIATFIMPKLFGKTPSTLPLLYDFTVALIMMELLGDFFLYWGHRVQHEHPYLWKNFHSFHHTIDTPSPVSTLYIDSNDATLQGSLPMILAGMIIRPHPFTFYVYMILRVGENVLNHSGILFLSCSLSLATERSEIIAPRVISFHLFISLFYLGMDCFALDLLTLKFIPGRAKVKHHDRHHKFSNYEKNAKNFGENFWIWDWMFGTLSKY